MNLSFYSTCESIFGEDIDKVILDLNEALSEEFKDWKWIPYCYLEIKDSKIIANIHEKDSENNDIIIIKEITWFYDLENFLIEIIDNKNESNKTQTPYFSYSINAPYSKELIERLREKLIPTELIPQVCDLYKLEVKKTMTLNGKNHIKPDILALYNHQEIIKLQEYFPRKRHSLLYKLINKSSDKKIKVDKLCKQDFWILLQFIEELWCGWTIEALDLAKRTFREIYLDWRYWIENDWSLLLSDYIN